MKDSQCEKCLKSGTAKYFEFQFGSPIDVKKNASTEGIYIVNTTTTTFQVFGNSGAYVCKKCIANRRLRLILTIPIGMLITTIGLVLGDSILGFSQRSTIFQIVYMVIIFIPGLLGLFNLTMGDTWKKDDKLGVKIAWKIRRKELKKQFNNEIENLNDVFEVENDVEEWIKKKEQQQN